MNGTVLEHIGLKKRKILVRVLLLCQLVCFLVALFAKPPTSSETIIATMCKEFTRNEKEFFLIARGSNPCKAIDYNELPKYNRTMISKLVFVFQMPLPREGKVLHFSRWQQSLKVKLDTEIVGNRNSATSLKLEFTVDMKLAYRNLQDPEDKWTYYDSSTEKRDLNCLFDKETATNNYDCDIIPAFTLGSLHHDLYMLNVRFPIDKDKNKNIGIGNFKNLHLTLLYQAGGFVKTFVFIKTVSYICVVTIVIWFYRRIRLMQRELFLLEHMLLYLGAALTLLNFPVEFISLFFEMKFMPLLRVTCNCVFYTALFSFWLVLAGEHEVDHDDDRKYSLKAYSRHMTIVGIGFVLIFLSKICLHGGQLGNSFFTIGRAGKNIETTSLTIATVLLAFYFLYLCYIVRKAFKNIDRKENLSASPLHYRSKVLLLVTLLCVLLTSIRIVLGQLTDSLWEWNETVVMDYASIFYMTVFGMWNIYIIALFILFAQSHNSQPLE